MWMMPTYKLHHGDALDVMSHLPARTAVCITDLPYGRTAAKWDKAIPAVPMWRELKRVSVPGRAVVLFGQQPFSSLLVTSNLKGFRYGWVWDKRLVTNGVNCRRMPLKAAEDILVFSDATHLYTPQMQPFAPGTHRRHLPRVETNPETVDRARRSQYLREGNAHRLAYPTNMIRIPALGRRDPERAYKHPTQKPVALLRYLIRTYSAPGDVILDFSCGSGTSGEAALLEGRHFVGIDSAREWVEVTEQRLAQVEQRVGEHRDASADKVGALTWRGDEPSARGSFPEVSS
jgi:hypothetical protein